MQNKYNKSIEIEWTPKNILLAISIIIILLSIAWNSIESTQKEMKAKRERLNSMTIEEVAEYIMEKNPGVIHIDAITKVYPISYHDKILEFPYHVTDGFLRKFTSGIYSNIKMKKHLQNDTLNEDCRKTAFSVFLQKGGVTHYTYHLQKNDTVEFLFEFNNTWDLCHNR